MRNRYLLFFIMLVSILNLLAQDDSKQNYIGQAVEMIHMPSIASKKTVLMPAKTKKAKMNDARASKNIIIPGKDSQKEDDYFLKHRSSMFQKNRVSTPSLIFDAYNSDSSPSDPSLAIGPNHIFVVFNTGFVIYDKEGHVLTDKIAPYPAIFPYDGCCDLTVSYDSAADRWVISFLSMGEGDNGSKLFGAQVAISDGPDPVNCGWNVYILPQISDYQKLSVWSDGYYVTDNTGDDNKVWVLERDKMLIGDKGAKIIGFSLPNIEVPFGFYSLQVLNVSNNNMPNRGNAPVVFLQDDAWENVDKDHIKVWLCNVDWKKPENSTMSDPQEIELKPFINLFAGGMENLQQPDGGAKIDALPSTIMNQAQFRKFEDYNSAVFNFVVDVSASGSEALAGIRWVELRQNGDGTPWYLYQEGTYTAPDNRHAWLGSSIMDDKGNIGLGYTSMSSNSSSEKMYVSTCFTGRYAGDPLGTMTVQEQVIAQGDGLVPDERYGDYCKIDIDPIDDRTFYFIDEYMKNNVRTGALGRFKLTSEVDNDLGVINIINPKKGALSDEEQVTVRVYNFGKNAISDFDISYQINQLDLVTETYTETISPTTYADFTFSKTVDLSIEGNTYTITAFTNLADDQDLTNNTYYKNIKHINHHNIGVRKIIAPSSGLDLASSEKITVLISNLGSVDQTNFKVVYDLDGTIVTETFTDVLKPNTSSEYTFDQMANFGELGQYNLTVYTVLETDADASDDSCSIKLTKEFCQPKGDCTDGDVIVSFNLGDINNETDCSPDGYADYTDQSTELILGETYDLSVGSHGAKEKISVWIDYNDDFIFSDNEIIINNATLDPDGQDSETIKRLTVDCPIKKGEATLGEHLLRVRLNFYDLITDACTDASYDHIDRYGETEDYKVIVVNKDSTLDVNSEMLKSANFIIKDLKDKIFELEMSNTDYSGIINVSVYNITGRRVVNYNMNRMLNKYTYTLNMNYMPSGVYLVRMGSQEFGKVQKIIVK